MPESHRELFHSVDEKKALEELERFQREIQSARWKREEATAEFERFVKGFREVPPHPHPPAAEPDSRPVAASAPSVVRALRRNSYTPPINRVSETPPAPPIDTPTAQAPTPEPPLAVAPAAPRPSASMRLQQWRGGALGVAAGVVVIGLSVQWWRAAPPPRHEKALSASQTRPSQPATTSSSNAATRAASKPVAAHTATLTTTGRVWVRVMADGHRLFERELPAGATVPLDATQAIVIRAGDAGAVKLTFADGRAEKLGATGQVVTKRFEVKR